MSKLDTLVLIVVTHLVLAGIALILWACFNDPAVEDFLLYLLGLVWIIGGSVAIAKI
ncbi:hypothetical protein [Paenibacillus chitinolyticus]|uniref:Uncharacterized protein n=1 Tax=Paenibacillus chitinolyticus TaxID=79263 RepID=A0ABT4FBH2_9BACL|nr:hypothetical protein [Paenibacillus chitinolyticus]MCY9588634.1 hypothetical protein [Paenibacillus chitinolyticus]MCY9595862.1 hypothetical protein [Paenibacillus chitinolyticus]